MSVFQSDSRSNGKSCISSKRGVDERISGWDELEIWDKVEEKKLEKRIIEIANQKILLEDVFTKYQIEFEDVYSATGWSLVCICPFKDHTDSKPSFGYNKQENIFNCFGCHRGGKAVEFVSNIENFSKLEAAKMLLGSSISFSEVIVKKPFDFKKFEQLLTSFAKEIFSFKRKHNKTKEAMDYAKAVTWGLDLYLEYAGSNMVIENLEARLEKLREQLALYGE